LLTNGGRRPLGDPVWGRNTRQSGRRKGGSFRTPGQKDRIFGGGDNSGIIRNYPIEPTSGIN